ncbi:MAG: AAA family ATPase [Lewinella sp.]|nr:AAA family ATPase [Lewinella sp.]
MTKSGENAPSSSRIDQSRYARTQGLLRALGHGLYEREDAVRLALLSAVAGESIFLLGPPGVGKSLIARRLKHAFRDGVSFEYLMSKFSTPDEVFGPVSIKKLKEEDKYERLTDRYLPGANIVFLDEIWKAGPAIQNALLTILNEKIYRNGDVDMRVNIRGIITASNELPPPNQSLAPIWDRFLIRLEMGNIRQFRNFLSMITETEDVYEDQIPEDHKLTEQELDEWSRAIDAVAVPPEVLNTIQVIKVKLDEHNARPSAAEPIVVHDRRWKKAIRLLRTSAFLNGRDRVDLMDCFLLEHCLWSRPSQREALRDLIAEAIRRHGYTMAVNLTALRKEIREFGEDVEQETRVKVSRTAEELALVKEEYFELVKDDQQFEGQLVPTKQFNQLELGEPEVVNFYDGDLNLVNRLRARKGAGEHTIEVYHNGVRYTYPLRTRKKEEVETVYKTPHPVVVKFWEERFQRLRHYVEEQSRALREEGPAELDQLENNLFVDQERAAIVRANHEEVVAALQQLKLRLEKIQFAYEREEVEGK